MEPSNNHQEIHLKSFFSRESIPAIRRSLLKSLVWVFIAAVIMGIFFILFSGSDSMDAIGRIYGTLASLAIFVCICFANLGIMNAKDDHALQLASVGLLANILTVFLWILFIWLPEPLALFTSCTNKIGFACHTEITTFGKFFFISISLSVFCILAALTFILREGSLKSFVHPLKITSLCCIIYEQLFWIVLVFRNWDVENNWSNLSWFLFGIYIISMTAALIIGNASSKQTHISSPASPNQPASPSFASNNSFTMSPNSPNSSVSSSPEKSANNSFTSVKSAPSEHLLSSNLNFHQPEEGTDQLIPPSKKDI